MAEKTEAERLVEEGNALLDTIDALDAREAKQRTMGSMAYSSYRSDLYYGAMRKFKEAIEAEKRETLPEVDKGAQ